jgi:Flp pilus assembly protein TadG
MSKRWQQFAQKFNSQEFNSNEDGTVAVLFGLLTFTMFVMSALAVDYGRVLDMRSRISSSVDAASLAAGKAMLEGKLSDAEIITVATKFFNEDVKPVKTLGTIGTPEIKIDRDNGTVDIDVNSSVKMTLGRVAGVDKMDVPVSSTATFKQKDIEVGMALDITGSMNDPVGGQRKIDGLKKAFENFAEKLIPDIPAEGQNVRIGIAPFAASVNLGNYSGAVTDGRSKDGCVVERRNGTFSDAAVIPDKIGSTTNPTAFQVEADGKQKVYCPSASIIPLTNDKDALIKAVKSFKPDFSTAGHIGTQWAFNLISEKWGGVWGGTSAPAPYVETMGTKPKLVKAVILMTDGIFNTQYHGGTARDQALKLCSAIKDQSNKNVVVFTIGFGLGGDPIAIKTLKDCATPSSTNEYFVNANDSGELDRALQKFAGKLGELRISR